jgi:alpha/beta superfamily hydrolase
LVLEFNAATLYSLGMTTIFIGSNPRLEALHEGNGSRSAVIMHPHPLYGGDMHNNVVLAARDSALHQGFMKTYLDRILKFLADQ